MNYAGLESLGADFLVVFIAYHKEQADPRSLKQNKQRNKKQ